VNLCYQPIFVLIKTLTQMKGINITLMFDGKRAAFDFYKSVFDADYSNFQHMKGMPNAPAMSAEESEKVLHATLPIGSAVLMGMDMPTGRGVVNPGNNL
jgi:PhnB protein